MWFLNAAAISAIAGLILSVSVFVVVIAAVRSKPDAREHALQILRILVRWRE